MNNNEVKGQQSKRMKFVLLGIIIVIAIVAAIAIVQYRKVSLERYKSSIDSQLINLTQLKNEMYFNDDYLKSISDIETNSAEAYSSKNLKQLSTISHQAADLYEQISTEIAGYNKYYKLLKETVEKTNSLKKHYFAKGYDTAKIDLTKENAEQALSNSDCTKYNSIYDSLVNQIKPLEIHISQSLENIYSKVTDEQNSEYPFVIKEENMPTTWSYKPLVKQTIECPTWVITREAEVLDAPPIANLFIDGSSAEYTYSISQIPTQEITIEDENREMKKALVNTEVKFKAKAGYEYDKKIPLNERPSYLFKNSKGQICLALKDYNGKENYILYIPG